MLLTTIARVVCDNDLDIINHDNFIKIYDLHITCLYLNKYNVSDSKLEFLKELRNTVKEYGYKVNYKVNGVYKGTGVIFAKVDSITINNEEIPKLSDMIYHITLYCDYNNGYRPVQSLENLRDGNYTKIQDFEGVYTGELEIIIQ